jgi:hypothetical protein
MLRREFANVKEHCYVGVTCILSPAWASNACADVSSMGPRAVTLLQLMTQELCAPVWTGLQGGLRGQGLVGHSLDHAVEGCD